MTDNKRTFESTMAELEAIVKKLEADDVPLEDAISYYEKGMRLSKWCDEKLAQVEKQMANIITEEGEIKPIDLEEE
ncbi:exodeoxyribonuclease VII small subunit [Amphibacillus xylanus]|uniref:Exodeoxyribonuclease 7 small subunit n=1 Tax=Amphibacillus xylanus (strain ATCC 51415 / DSM 6626 / JCM 7361 / LMG 17667 / NBRC 15112 / Ep01) TaxID=698758 RepID=K0IY11_AMPXN|nr:exodeoxyribonuclease VII small subunit [Amphibacillus xylanus]BAM47309.1 exodeoxyribonuclease VII small subunit [Amphibacillus xylanus NBRC 15112]